MNYGNKIAELRKSKNLTQSELGTKLNITAQAVSKWENDLSEPDLDSIKKMCEIFGVSVDAFLGISTSSEPEKPATQPTTPAPAPANEPVKIINGYCEKCKKPVGPGEYEITNLSYNGARLYKIEESKTQHIFCNDCYKTIKDIQAKEKAKKEQIERLNEQKEEKSKFKKGFLWGSIVCVLIFLLLFFSTKDKPTTEKTIGLVVLTVGGFTATSQVFWGDFIGDVFLFFCRSFRAPFGLIFELSLDGLLWLITVKLALWIICGILSVLWFILGLLVTSVISFFTFPFQLVMKIREIKSFN